MKVFWHVHVFLHLIQVFLHPKQELPQVRDLGFAIAPGVHALIAVRLNEVYVRVRVCKTLVNSA